jgi:protein-S-isoprenylcysteine O-methyltransferase Ste14
MSTTLVMVLRGASLLAFAAPMLLLAVARRARRPDTRPGRGRGDRAPLLANLTAFCLFFPSLLTFPGILEGRVSFLLALTGCLLASAGAALVLRARMELGSAWSLVPVADEAAGLITTGPYRLVRHPIYLGLSILATGQSLAFASWPAFFVVLAGIVPTFVWRACAEEKLLIAAFGERYARYQEQTKMVIPRLV